MNNKMGKERKLGAALTPVATPWPTIAPKMTPRGEEAAARAGEIRGKGEGEDVSC